jgi:hypothetical protein
MRLVGAQLVRAASECGDPIAVQGFKARKTTGNFPPEQRVVPKARQHAFTAARSHCGAPVSDPARFTSIEPGRLGERRSRFVRKPLPSFIDSRESFASFSGREQDEMFSGRFLHRAAPREARRFATRTRLGQAGSAASRRAKPSSSFRAVLAIRFKTVLAGEVSLCIMMANPDRPQMSRTSHLAFSRPLNLREQL